MSGTTELLVIDAHAVAYRAYYAMSGQNLLNQEGQPTGAIHGFFRMFFKLLQEYRPAMIAVTWDPSGPTFRHTLFPDYKAHRSPMPEDLRFQIDEIKDLLRETGFSILISPGDEADDIMGALAVRFGKSHPVILLTGDKDCFQLLNENVRMLRGTKGVTEFIEIDPSWVERELGVKVEQIPDYMALVGDASDNIPGAKGIGPKGAQKLIQDYGSIEGIYQKLDTVKPDSTRKKLEDARKEVFLSKELATIRRHLPLVDELDPGLLRTPDYLSEGVLQHFRSRGYKLVYQDLLKAFKAGDMSTGAESAQSTKAVAARKAPSGDTLPRKNAGAKKAAATSRRTKGDSEGQSDLFSSKEDEELFSVNEDGEDPAGDEHSEKDRPNAKPLQRYNPSTVDYRFVETMGALDQLAAELSRVDLLCIDVETTGLRPTEAEIVGIALSWRPGMARYISLPPDSSLFPNRGMELERARPVLKRILENPLCRYIGQNIKYDHVVLKRHGFQIPNIVFDTMIASYLMNPNVRGHNMDDMAVQHLDYDTVKFADVAGTGRKQVSLDKVDPDAVSVYSCEDADITFRLHDILAPGLMAAGLQNVNDQLEVPLIDVLADMELAGVAIDSKYFGKLSADYENRIQSLERMIFEETGHEFNINSTKELQFVLFEKMKLPVARKTKTGYSTDQSVLDSLKGLHPVVDHLLDHRKYSKLKGTYVDALPALVNTRTGRIHTSFSQTIAATGRLSSNDPNLQNIPVREDTGRAIRRGFIPASGNILLSLDYSQIELRIMAHYAGDAALIEAFSSDQDIHRRTAASLFGIKEEEVDADRRAQAKTVNFSIIYGVTAFGLSQNLGVPRETAQTYIDRFFQAYPGVKRYMEDMTSFAEKHGYVQTLSGRRRQIIDIRSANRFRREGAARIAVNTPVQGTSADIIKLAMIQIHDRMKDRSGKAKMILQVHDELLFDVPPEEADEIEDLARVCMEGAMQLTVPLRVDAGRGANWDEAH